MTIRRKMAIAFTVLLSPFILLTVLPLAVTLGLGHLIFTIAAVIKYAFTGRWEPLWRLY